MRSIITIFCIIGLCIFVYSYKMMVIANKDWPRKCRVLYVPRYDVAVANRLPHTEVLDHEEHDSKFIHTRYSTAPTGVSDIDEIIPLNNVIYDRSNMVELGE